MLNQKQYMLLFELTEITESIKVIYDYLKDLETIGQKDSEEYKKYMDYLTICLEVENNKYNEKMSTKDLEEIFMYLNKQKDSDKKNTDKLLCYERIRNNIFMKLTKNLNSEVYHMDGEIEELELSIEKMNEILNMAKANDYEYNILLLSLIDKKIIDDETQFTEELIDFKYTACFCDREIENLVIENNFSVKTKNYYMIDDGDELFKSGREEFAKKIALKTMSKMLVKTEDDEKIDLKRLLQLYNLCTSLMMLYDTPSFTELKTNFLEMEQKSIYSALGMRLITKAFNETHKLKSKNKILTLKV